MAMQPVWTNQSGVSVAGTSTTSVLIIPDGISILMAFVLVTTGSSLRMSLQIAPTATGPWQTVGSTPTLSDGMNGAASGQSYGAGFARLIVTNGVASSVSIWLTTEIVDGLGGSGGGGGLSTSVAVTSMPSLSPGSNAIGSVSVSSIPALPTGSNTIGNVNLNNGATVGISSIPALPTGTNTIGTVNVGTYPLNMQPPTIRSRETISLTSPLTNSVVNISGYTVVRNFNVISLTGSATLSINGTSNPVPLLQGDQLSDMNITSMYISTTGNAGWTITIELQGN